ncbi:YuiB family protein [Metabacillus sp. GX 13764]|uniref:YuiB family protein n=1 Tax=Metabacillus kandeliae TaxID=2900151 RepID=UPI001E57782B|nr:YuiB family protein [Metabacillus kandeliae]MCD7036234.1 YuiB family protein [Metabacillus kandeliae]
MNIAVVIISMVLFFVLFFGIGFILNMLLRKSWVMAIVYPLVCIAIIQQINVKNYFTMPVQSFESLGHKIVSLAPADMLILSSGLTGAILAGITIKTLRKRGYQMF